MALWEGRLPVCKNITLSHTSHAGGDNVCFSWNFNLYVSCTQTENEPCLEVKKIIGDKRCDIEWKTSLIANSDSTRLTN